jgi:hypothetical protein
VALWWPQDEYTVDLDRSLDDPDASSHQIHVASSQRGHLAPPEPTISEHDRQRTVRAARIGEQ